MNAPIRANKFEHMQGRTVQALASRLGFLHVSHLHTKRGVHRKESSPKNSDQTEKQQTRPKTRHTRKTTLYPGSIGEPELAHRSFVVRSVSAASLDLEKRATSLLTKKLMATISKCADLARKLHQAAATPCFVPELEPQLEHANMAVQDVKHAVAATTHKKRMDSQTVQNPVCAMTPIETKESVSYKPRRKKALACIPYLATTFS